MRNPVLLLAVVSDFCVLLVQVPGGARRGLERLSPVGMATCFLLLTFSASDVAKLDDDRVITVAISFRGRENAVPSDHQDFQTTNVPAETSSQRETSRELTAIVFVLGYNRFCPDERVHFF